MRTAAMNRTTAETDISLTLELDGTGVSQVDTGCGFLDHMLTLFARHGRFDLQVTCKGDTYVDDHHTVEDIGICLGDAFAQALGEKRGIRRYGSSILPMDEALLLTAVDISGRGMAFLEVDGDMVEKNLAPGEVLKVDTGNVVAFERSVGYEIETVKGLGNIFFGGEGLFLTTLKGPGKVYLQTQNIAEFAGRIARFIPTSGK